MLSSSKPTVKMYWVPISRSSTMPATSAVVSAGDQPGSLLRILEPPWKMLLSNKAILPVLWEMFPDHPNLLAASFEPGRFATDFVKKPLYSREGANVSITAKGGTVEAPGEYGEEGYIFE